jgi:hypothetical protein
MAKIEVIADRVEVEKGRIVIEMSVPLDFLREAVKNSDTIKQTFAVAFADAMDDFMTRKKIQA